MKAIEVKEKIKEIYKDTIKDFTEFSSLKGIPSGELYANLMLVGITLEVHQGIIRELVEEKKIKQENFLLTYIGE